MLRSAAVVAVALSEVTRYREAWWQSGGLSIGDASAPPSTRQIDGGVGGACNSILGEDSLTAWPDQLTGRTVYDSGRSSRRRRWVSNTSPTRNELTAVTKPPT